MLHRNCKKKKRKKQKENFLFFFFFACSNTTVDTDTIYSDLHIFKIPPGAPKALLLQDCRGPGGWLLWGPAWEEAGQAAACWQPAEVRCHSGDTEGVEGWEKAWVLGKHV